MRLRTLGAKGWHTGVVLIPVSSGSIPLEHGLVGTIIGRRSLRRIGV